MFVLTNTSGKAVLCSSCLDKAYPELALGSLADDFMCSINGSQQCPYCGWTVPQTKELGLVGCPLCYEALDGEIWSDFGVKTTAPTVQE